jgi:hypothetical protein
VSPSSDALNMALQLAPNNLNLINLIQELRQGDLTQEIPVDKCAYFNVALDGSKYICGLFNKDGRPCPKSFDRFDRFKYHLQAHLGLTPYKCKDSTKVTPEPKWYVLIPCFYVLSFNHNASDRMFSSITARDTHVNNKGSVMYAW